jgi:hypothetical protein
MIPRAYDTSAFHPRPGSIRIDAERPNLSKRCAAGFAALKPVDDRLSILAYESL